jgi:superfamily I DNA/RNA helicase
LQERFPLVFFDETQDTVFQQAQLFDIIFPENCLVQRFGDDRQAIYHSTLADEEGAHFPRGKQSQMQESFRLSPSIAHLSETVCADNPPESLQGDKQKPDRRHTVFVFKRTSIQKVLTAFCDLVSSEIGPGLDPNEIQAVGANTKPKSELKKFPSAITDYWPDFVPKNEQIKARLASLPAYLDELRKEIRTTQSTVSARQLLLQSCARILRLQGVLDNGRRLTPSAMMDKLKNQDPENYHKLNSFLARTCQKILSVNEPTAQAVADELRPLLALFNAQAWNHEVRQFILQTSGASSPKNRKSTPEENVFVRTNAGDTVSVKVDTIHSVKGKTLTAVLVLETVYFEHDLQVLTKKGYLTGRPPSVAPAKRLLGHLKRIYVAMTRPTDLLCLAILDEHLSDGDRDLLLKRGWAIKEV